MARAVIPFSSLSDMWNERIIVSRIFLFLEFPGFLRKKKLKRTFISIKFVRELIINKDLPTPRLLKVVYNLF